MLTEVVDYSGSRVKGHNAHVIEIVANIVGSEETGDEGTNELHAVDTWTLVVHDAARDVHEEDNVQETVTWCEWVGGTF